MKIVFTFICVWRDQLKVPCLPSQNRFKRFLTKVDLKSFDLKLQSPRETLFIEIFSQTLPAIFFALRSKSHFIIRYLIIPEAEVKSREWFCHFCKILVFSVGWESKQGWKLFSIYLKGSEKACFWCCKSFQDYWRSLHP